jgi:DNA-binding response OmpR family regulator
MTGMSGYELLREVRTDPHLEMTPVLLMTADPGVIALIRETDLTQYLVKPFSAGVLKAKLQGLLASVSPKNE